MEGPRHILPQASPAAPTPTRRETHYLPPAPPGVQPALPASQPAPHDQPATPARRSPAGTARPRPAAPRAAALTPALRTSPPPREPAHPPASSAPARSSRAAHPPPSRPSSAAAVRTSPRLRGRALQHVPHSASGAVRKLPLNPRTTRTTAPIGPSGFGNPLRLFSTDSRIHSVESGRGSGAALLARYSRPVSSSPNPVAGPVTADDVQHAVAARGRRPRQRDRA